jgi:hypothetical protein
MSLATGLSFAALQPPLHPHTLLSLQVRIVTLIFSC